MTKNEIFEALMPMLKGFYQRRSSLCMSCLNLRNVILNLHLDVMKHLSRADPSMRDADLVALAKEMNNAKENILLELYKIDDEHEMQWQGSFLKIMDYFSTLADFCDNELPEEYWEAINIDDEPETDEPSPTATPSVKKKTSKDDSLMRIATVLERLESKFDELIASVKSLQ